MLNLLKEWQYLGCSLQVFGTEPGMPVCPRTQTQFDKGAFSAKA